MNGNFDCLKVNHLTVSFEGPSTFKALDNISFSIPKGKTLALVGQSGSGKSITSLAIMGLLPPNAQMTGTIEMNGFPPFSPHSGKELQKIRGKEIAMIFQEPMSALNPIMKVGKQLMESILVHQKIKQKEAKKIAIDWFRKVKLPNPELVFHKYPHQLSGGQKQRVMIAMAMCNHPQLLIADEATTALDVTVQAEIIALMKHLQQETGTSYLFITHDLALAAQIADDFLILEKGKIIEHPMSLKMTQKQTFDLPLEPVLALKNIVVQFPQKINLFGKPTSFLKAVNDVSFELYKGETLGLVGESGCGKSTLSRALMGLQKIDSGQIFLKGHEITHFSSSEWNQTRRSIQIVFQDPYASLNPRLKVGDAIKEPMIAHRMISSSEAEKKLHLLLEQVELPISAKNKYPHEFSGGQRQRISIARALAMQPEIIICDESVAALDIQIQNQILQLLQNIQKENQLSYLFITHDLNVVNAISHRILVMKKGKIVESGSTDQVMKQPQQEYTKQLIAAIPGGLFTSNSD